MLITFMESRLYILSKDLDRVASLLKLVIIRSLIKSYRTIRYTSSPQPINLNV